MTGTLVGANTAQLVFSSPFEPPSIQIFHELCAVIFNSNSNLTSIWLHQTLILSRLTSAAKGGPFSATLPFSHASLLSPAGASSSIAMHSLPAWLRSFFRLQLFFIIADLVGIFVRSVAAAPVERRQENTQANSTGNTVEQNLGGVSPQVWVSYITLNYVFFVEEGRFIK